jgi:hypothetical protein
MLLAPLCGDNRYISVTAEKNDLVFRMLQSFTGSTNLCAWDGRTGARQTPFITAQDIVLKGVFLQFRS